MSGDEKIRLLYLCQEQWPTFRPDVTVLFGKYLPRFGVASDLVTDEDPHAGSDSPQWGGGHRLLSRSPKSRAGQYLFKTWHNVRMLVQCNAGRYDAIQVRDMPLTALAALFIARLKGLPFFYWMSFPQSEAQILRAKSRGPRAGLRYWFPLIQGTLGAWVLYRMVLPRAAHIFVQSQKMLADLTQQRISPARMTVVPMGVDTETAAPDRISPSDDARLAGKRVVVYLGAFDRPRKIEVLLEMVAIVRRTQPDILLILAGDTDDIEHRAWLQSETTRFGIAEAVLYTGWLPAQQAWRYVRAAEVGLSSIPRGIIFDCSSPTKVIEYLALGLPVIVNDSPDQARVVSESAAGLCVNLDAGAFAHALLTLLADGPRRVQMGNAGQRYVRKARSYSQLAQELAAAYRRILDESGNRHRVAQ